MEKMKRENLGGIQQHNQRETDNHSNKDIDVTRSYLNYDLVNTNGINYREKIQEIIDSQRVSKRAVRKDAVLVDEWIITSDRPFFENANTETFFQDALDYFSERCGKQNIAYATVHLDETTPHMHLGIVPMTEGRLSSKQLFSRQSLREIQDELPRFLQERGHAIERGIKGSEQKHLTVEEYKDNQQAIKEMDQVLQAQKNELTIVEQQITSETQSFTTELAQMWKVDWLATLEHSPYFELIYEVREPITNEPTQVYVNEHTPSDYRMTFQEIIGLFKEKFSQFKAYIAQKWQKLTAKGVELENRSNSITERENSLESKLERLTAEVRVKETQSAQLGELIDSKTRYIDRLTEVSELSMMTPSYVKPSKLNKEVWIVPKEKWEAKHVSANAVNELLKLKETFSRTENQIQRQAQEGISNWTLQSEKTKLQYENEFLKQEQIGLINGYVRLYNQDKLSKKDMRSVLSDELQQTIGLEPIHPKIENHRNMNGPTLSM